MGVTVHSRAVAEARQTFSGPARRVDPTIIFTVAGISPRTRTRGTDSMIAVIGNFIAGALALGLFGATVRLSR